MKTFKKVLASALAAAMVVTAFPVTNAEAASTAKLSATKATLYVGQSKTLKVTTPKTWKSVKVTATSSKKSVATVKKSGKKVTVKAVKAGTAKVTVKVTAKKSGKKVSKTLKATVTVKNPTLTVKAAATELAVGETTTVKATTKPSKTVTFSSDKEDVATVDAKTGVVTAVKAGEATITAKAGKLTKAVKVTVKNVIFKEVKQTKADTLEATIAGATKDLKADDVKITNTKTNVVYVVKSVAVDKTDATKVTIETFVKMNDGNDYSVVIADTTKTFTATDNKVAAVSVTPVTVPYATLSTISAVATDAKGVVLAEEKIDNGTLAGKTMQVTLTPATGGYTSGSLLFLAKKGDTATVKVTLKSGEYDTTGQEINNITSGDVTITAVDQEAAPTVTGFKLRVAKDNAKSYDKVAENSSVAVGTRAYAYLKITNSKNEEIAAADYANYKVSSSDTNVLVMSEQPATNAAISVMGVNAGNAYIIVKDTKNKDAVVATIPVTVNAKSAVTAFSLDRTSFVLATTTDVNTEVVNMTVKDQYNEEMKSGFDTKIELLSSPAGATADMVSGAAIGTKITFTGDSSAKEGNYVFKVTVTDPTTKVERSQVVTATVKKPEGTETYAFEISDSSVDTTLKDGVTPEKKEVTIKIIKTKGGVKTGYVADTTGITVKNGNEVATIASGSTAKIASFTAIDVDSSSNNIATAAAAGTYVVSGKVNVGGKDVNIASATFTVKNDTAKVTASQISDTISTSTLNAAELCKAFKFTWGTKELKDTDITVNEVKAVVDGAAEANVTSVGTGKVAYITTVKLAVKIDGTNSFYTTVTINKSVTGK